MKKFRFRAFLSLTLFFSFLLTALSGVALYLRPEGSVSRWTGWRMLGLDKNGWEGVHTLFCIVFVVVAAIHLFLNGKALIRYIRDRAARGRRLRWEPAAALLLTGVVLLLAVYRVPPLSGVLEWRADIKRGAGRVRIDPPEADFEKRPLDKVANDLNYPVSRLVERLRGRGLDIPSIGDSLEDIARRNRLAPQDLYEKILRAVEDGRSDSTQPPETRRPS